MCAVLRKVEATLYYASDPELAFSTLAENLVNAFEYTSVTLHPHFQSETELGCTVGGLTLTLVRHPNMQKMPPLPQGPTPDIQCTVFTVRISGAEQCAQTATRLSLCYVGVMHLLNLARADRIHWGYTNMIHTAASFLLESSGRHMRPNAGPIPRPSSKNALAHIQTAHRKKDRAANQPNVHIKAPFGTPLIQSEEEMIKVFEKIRSPMHYGIGERFSQYLPRLKDQ